MRRPRTPALNDKFKLLIDLGHFKDKAEIATAFDRSVKTLEVWASGQAGIRIANDMPSVHLPTFCNLIAKCFPEDMPRSFIEELAAADRTVFEAALLDQQTATLANLLASEGRSGGFSLFSLPVNAQVGLVESDLQETPSPDFSVKINQWFRLELPTRTNQTHCVVLQNGGGLWGTVPHAFINGSTQLCIPGFKPDGQMGFIRETQASGRHRFIVMQTSQPISIIIRQSLRERAALGAQTLRLIAGFYDEQRRTQKSLSYVDIQINDR